MDDRSVVLSDEVLAKLDAVLVAWVHGDDDVSLGLSRAPGTDPSDPAVEITIQLSGPPTDEEIARLRGLGATTELHERAYRGAATRTGLITLAGDPLVYQVLPVTRPQVSIGGPV